jgi:hypothetical protein
LSRWTQGQSLRAAPLRARSSTRTTLAEDACDIAVDVKARNLAVLVVVLLVVGFSVIGVLVRRKDRALRTAQAATSNPAIETSTGLVPPQEAIARQRRDELRQRILQAWANGAKGEDVAKEAREGRFEERVGDASANGWGIEPSYIQGAMREQMSPMVEKCYEDYLTRAPDAGGRVELWFKIVADENLGGVVEEDEDHDAGMVSGWSGDEKMRTCLRESLLTVTFPRPGRGGVVTVGYPVELAPGEEDAGQ